VAAAGKGNVTIEKVRMPLKNERVTLHIYSCPQKIEIVLNCLHSTRTPGFHKGIAFSSVTVPTPKLLSGLLRDWVKPFRLG
jgi:hypothetical protein